MTEWLELIRPGTVNLIVGYKGRGKSALAFYLQESIAGHHNLQRVVCNFPEEKRDLLPESVQIASLEQGLAIESSFIIVDEGTSQLPAGSKLEEFIKGVASLSRQKDQVVVFIFHASRDVGSRIIRSVDSVLIKEPSRRQIQQGSKDKWFQTLLESAKRELFGLERPVARWTYVDCEEPDFQGVLENPVPSFWSEELSTAWKGVDLFNQQPESVTIRETNPLFVRGLNNFITPSIDTDTLLFWGTVESVISPASLLSSTVFAQWKRYIDPDNGGMGIDELGQQLRTSPGHYQSMLQEHLYRTLGDPIVCYRGHPSNTPVARRGMECISVTTSLKIARDFRNPNPCGRGDLFAEHEWIVTELRTHPEHILSYGSKEREELLVAVEGLEVVGVVV